MLDLQTLTFSSVLAALISSAFFIFSWFINRRIKGINLWLAAMLMQPLGWLLLSLRGNISNHLSMLVANVLLILSMLLFLLGWRTFLNLRSESKKSIIIFLCVFCAIFPYYIYVSPDIIARILLIHCTSAVFMSLCLYSFFSLSKSQRTVGGVLFCVICTLILFFNLFRALSAVFFEQTSGLFDVTLTNLLNPLFGFLIPYGLTLSIFLLCNERQLLEIKALEKKAKDDVKIKQRTLTMLSHELRTPLNGMIGKAQLMRPLLNSEQMQKDCDVIIESGQALSQLTSEVLEFTLLDQEEGVIAVETELVVYLNNIVELLMPLAKKKNINLALNVSSDYRLLLDQNKIRQVLINLLDNAIKFTEQGEVSLTVNVEASRSNEMILTFIIADTGEGISTSQSDLLLRSNGQGIHRFIHEHKFQKGYGLGLSLCDKLLHKMGSYLDCTNLEGQGSEFYFSIISQISDDKFHRSHTTLTYAEGLTILLVEDIQLNQDIARAMLENDKHHVVVANTGSEAINFTSSQLFDIILLDMQLPDMHGLEALKEIRQQPNFNINTQVIALTATITTHDLNLYKQANIFDLIEKPILLPKLRKIIFDCYNAEIKQQKTEVFTQIDKTDSALIPVVFDEKPLSFLSDNLPAERFKEMIFEAPENIKLYVDNAHKSTDYYNQVEWLHKLAGYSAQLGLTRLSKKAVALEKKAKQQQCIVPIDFGQVMEQSIEALNHVR